jgi:casein kinase II subunit beta
LYGLIHKKYVQSPLGLSKVYNKFLQGVFGYCPRALCDRQKVLPCGLSDNLRTSRFKVFCPRCEEAYMPKFKSINIDGAYFGTSLPHIFLMHYPEAIILPPKVYYYEPKIYGFKIYGKRGSKAYKPVLGQVKYIEDSMSCLEKENLALEIRDKNRQQKPLASPHKASTAKKGGDTWATKVN